MKTGLVLFTAFSLFGAATLAAEKPAADGAAPGQWTMDFDAARKVAAERKLPLLLNFTGSDWCAWCKLMDKQVFSQAAWQTFAKNSLMLVWLDFPNDKTLVPEKHVARNRALYDLFGIQGFPSYIVLDDDGKTQLGQLGADKDITPELFIARLSDVLQERESERAAFLKNAPEKTAQEFREAVQKRDAARADLKALEALYEKRGSELKKLVDDQGKRLKDLRTEVRISKLPTATADAFRTKKARHDAVSAELKTWLDTSPPSNEENMKKHKAMRSELSTLEKEMRELLAK